ncbi:MAG: histidinol dehydrogenase [Hydrogenothermaceae bacterium]|nr:histidinol dehydrogenase [Hydrogenothermaceae bacterium]
MRIVDLRGRYYRENRELKELIERSEIEVETYEKSVREIISAVKEEGDTAVLRYTKFFDKVDLSPDDMVVPYSELEKAYEELDPETRWTYEVTVERITEFHSLQLEKSFFKEESGMILGQKVLPLERVGLYVPGGKAAYPSSVIMNAIPAKVAGVKEIVMSSPNPNRCTLAAAFICGIGTVYRIGGAQAVAAMAFGTKTVKKVDKIVGPGNIYVALAKKNLYGYVDIDMIAGPSEILVIADDTANPRWVATDLLSQAEHDELAAAILVTTSMDLAREVKEILYRELLVDFSRKEIAQKSLDNYGHIFVVDDLNIACEVSNYIAPEHLEIVTKNPFDLLNNIKNAGAIFLGEYSTEPLGDYILGPNHVLPTASSARFSSPLGVYDFLKRSSIIYVSKEGFERVAKHAINMAKSEGLDAHKMSVEIRLNTF